MLHSSRLFVLGADNVIAITIAANIFARGWMFKTVTNAFGVLQMFWYLQESNRTHGRFYRYAEVVNATVEVNLTVIDSWHAWSLSTWTDLLQLFHKAKWSFWTQGTKKYTKLCVLCWSNIVEFVGGIMFVFLTSCIFINAMSMRFATWVFGPRMRVRTVMVVMMAISNLVILALCPWKCALQLQSLKPL